MKVKKALKKALIPHDAKLLLDHIVKVLNVNDENSRNLWHILTALRGPDTGTTAQKLYTTGRIRDVIGLQQVGNWATSECLNPSEIEERDKIMFDLPNVSWHFVSHYQNAVEAIELLYGYDLTTEKTITEKR